MYPGRDQQPGPYHRPSGSEKTVRNVVREVWKFRSGRTLMWISGVIYTHLYFLSLSIYIYIYTYTIIYRYHHISHIRDVHPNSPICSGVFEGPCHASALFPPRWLIGCETKSSSLALGMWNQPIAIARYPQVNIRIAMERSTMLLMGKSTISMSHFQ